MVASIFFNCMTVSYGWPMIFGLLKLPGRAGAAPRLLQKSWRIWRSPSSHPYGYGTILHDASPLRNMFGASLCRVSGDLLVRQADIVLRDGGAACNGAGVVLQFRQ